MNWLLMRAYVSGFELSISFSTQHVNVHVPQAPGAQEVDLTRMP